MATVYSSRFISQQGVNGDGETVTVPEGHRHLIKQLTFYSNPSLGVVRGFFRDLQTGATLFGCATGVSALGLPEPGWFGFFGSLVFDELMQYRWETASTLTDAADVGAFGWDLTL